MITLPSVASGFSGGGLESAVRGIFAGGVKGAWYDPSDYTTLFQDSAGTTAVTAVEQPVGKMLDKSGNNNHASQATTASCPVLRARYNLLTYSEQFNNSTWSKGNVTVSANAAAAPDGTTTADLLYPSSSGTFRWTYQALSSASAVYTRSVYAKAQNKSIVYIDPTGAGTVFAYFNLSSGTVGTVSAGYTATITAVGSGWYRCTMTNSTATTFSFSGVYGVADADGSPTVTANGTDGIYIWGGQFVYGSSAGTYQRIAAATDYDTVGFLPYLAFDGSNDSFATGSINFTATDKMFVCAGVTKLSDAASGIVVELSANYNSNFGSFYLAAPEDSSIRYSLNGRGDGAAASGQRADTSSTTYNAPSTVVQTGIYNISGASNNLRLNGTSIATGTGTQGSGNYGNYPLYIGQRNGATIPLNGRIYSLIVAGTAISSGQVSMVEKYVATKTGVTI